MTQRAGVIACIVVSGLLIAWAAVPALPHNLDARRFFGPSTPLKRHPSPGLRSPLAWASIGIYTSVAFQATSACLSTPHPALSPRARGARVAEGRVRGAYPSMCL
jgi:hypothetical protein